MASLEICCFNVTSALNASRAGATRIELCGDEFDGGSTPDFNWFFQLRYMGNIVAPINVMIRPRGGDFKYTSEEYQSMITDVQKFKDDKHSKTDGFVFGILDNQNGVDLERNKKLVELASPLPCTFHRAFDEIAIEDMAQALEEVILCGFKYVLTSGGKKTAVDGVETLQRLVKQAGERINVMPGGGVRSENIQFLVQETGAKWVHSSVLVDGEKVAAFQDIKKLLEVLKNSAGLG